MTTEALQGVIERILAVYGRWTRETTVDEMRRDWETLFPPPAGWGDAARIEANGVPARWIRPADTEAGGAILFLHGGGFQLGSTRTHARLMADIAEAGGCPVLGIDYRLAPEHKFPAQLEDALAAYDWLREQGYPPHRLALAGDSAGGGLVLSLLLALKARGDVLPAAAAVLSPWTDMEASGASFETRASSDPIHQRAMILALARSYLGRDRDPRDPLASPIHADLGGLPPLLIQVGDRETVLDDARMLAEKAQAAGVPVTLEVWDHMIHVFQMYPDDLSDARDAIARIGAFLRTHLDFGPGVTARREAV